MNDPVRPEYIRTTDMKYHFGIVRSAAYELLAEKKIRSVVIKKRGNSRGIRLIEYASVVTYLQSLSEPVDE